MRLSLLSWFLFCQNAHCAHPLFSAMTSKHFAGACRHTWRRHVGREKRRVWPFSLRAWLTYFDGEWRAPRKCRSGAQSKQKQAPSEYRASRQVKPEDQLSCQSRWRHLLPISLSSLLISPFRCLLPFHITTSAHYPAWHMQSHRPFLQW